MYQQFDKFQKDVCYEFDSRSTLAVTRLLPGASYVKIPSCAAVKQFLLQKECGSRNTVVFTLSGRG